MFTLQCVYCILLFKSAVMHNGLKVITGKLYIISRVCIIEVTEFIRSLLSQIHFQELPPALLIDEFYGESQGSCRL